VAASWCIAGLGNPGRDYAATRHNLGFRVVDELAGSHGGRWISRRAYDHCELAGLNVLLVKPMTYMNASGPALRQFLAYRNIGPDRLVVVCDDLHLPLGSLRLRAAGSDGGHNGLRSVIEAMGGGGFPRLRMGLGRNPAGVDSADYVLSPFPRPEAAAVRDMISRAANGLECLANQGLALAISAINQNKQ